MPEWVLDAAAATRRADVILAELLVVSRARAQRLLESGAATVNGRPARPGDRLREGDRVVSERPEPAEPSVLPEEIPLRVVFEDADLLVIDKPRGMVVHPAPGARSGTVVNAVLAHVDDLSGIGGELRPGIVHRLDKDTTGLLVVAKNDAAHRSLQQQIQARTAERRYRAILWGVPGFERVEIDAPIGRNPRDRKKMAVITDARHTARGAVTELTVLEALSPFSFVEARLQTGRTHQIRVHCAYVGHPVVGDPLYGGQRRVPSQGIRAADHARMEAAISALGGQALHAFSLSFVHPRTGQHLQFFAPLPDDVASLLDMLRKAHSGDSPVS